MDFITVTHNDTISTVAMCRGKVNALNEQLLDELSETFKTLEADDGVGAIILTGTGKFFSFGFDIPLFYDYTPEDFRRFIEKFTAFYTYLYLYPKPVIAAINGHAVAGGCMICNSCDYSIVAQGRVKMALNELAFGSTVFAGSVEILKAIAGQKGAEMVLFTGDMFAPEQALTLGLVDEVVDETNLMERAVAMAERYGRQHAPAFASIKRFLRQRVVDSYKDREQESIDEFIGIWYSETLRKNLKNIKIH